MIRLAVRCRPELAERVLAELVELASGGVEEDRGDGYVELAVYGPPGELPEVPALEAVAGKGLIEITSSEIPDDWADRWRDFHAPASIAAGRIVVAPSWHQRSTETAGDRGAGPGQPGVTITIDPGRAFGTGAHATTRMCLGLLLELADAGGAEGSLADLGTGSGVLAIAAAKLGWGPVAAIDSEAAALEAARANAVANGVSLDLRRLNLRAERPPAAATIVANLTGSLLVEVASRLSEPPQAMVCSGLLASERDAVAGALEAAGVTVAAQRVDGEWAAMRLARASDGASG